MKEAIRILTALYGELCMELMDEVDELENVIRRATGTALVERATAIRNLEIAMQSVIDAIVKIENAENEVENFREWQAKELADKADAEREFIDNYRM